jgi:hypothetical protein
LLICDWTLWWCHLTIMNLFKRFNNHRFHVSAFWCLLLVVHVSCTCVFDPLLWDFSNDVKKKLIFVCEWKETSSTIGRSFIYKFLYFLLSNAFIQVYFLFTRGDSFFSVSILFIFFHRRRICCIFSTFRRRLKKKSFTRFSLIGALNEITIARVKRSFQNKKKIFLFSFECT